MNVMKDDKYLMKGGKRAGRKEDIVIYHTVNPREPSVNPFSCANSSYTYGGKHRLVTVDVVKSQTSLYEQSMSDNETVERMESPVEQSAHLSCLNEECLNQSLRGYLQSTSDHSRSMSTARNDFSYQYDSDNTDGDNDDDYDGDDSALPTSSRISICGTRNDLSHRTMHTSTTLSSTKSRMSKGNVNSMKQPYTPMNLKRTPVTLSKRSSTTLSTMLVSSASTTGKSLKAFNSTKGSQLNWGLSHCIMAITEGRGLAAGEVGMAAMDPRRPNLILCQISDTLQYQHSLAKMNIINFVEALIPSPSNSHADRAYTKLYQEMVAKFPSVSFTDINRHHFCHRTGLKLIRKYVAPDFGADMVIIKDKYYALSAAGALLKYIEFRRQTSLPTRILKLEYQGSEGTMIIDLDSADRLELVMNLQRADEKSSLLGVVKCCSTKGGLRLLRANLLQPFTDFEKINTRLNCVTELIENPAFYSSLQVALSHLKNVENLLTIIMYPPQHIGLKEAETQLKDTFMLQNTLVALELLKSALSDATSDYFCIVREHLEDPRYTAILDRIHLTMLPTNGPTRKSFDVRGACSLFKPEINGLLDVARRAYAELCQQVEELHASTQEKYGELGKIILSYSYVKGYHFCLSPHAKDKTINEKDLPKEFTLINRTKTRIFFVTSELAALDQRCHQALAEIILMGNVLIYELLSDIRTDMSCFYYLCEYVAELDVCVAFAHVSQFNNFVRPKFGNETNLVEARHPILELLASQRIVPNSITMSNEKNFVLLTGANQSGKSIFIRQVALLQILGQVGCYVPAEEATFRIADRIFARMGCDDSIESNASSLLLEMKDIEFIKRNMSPTSLIIVDELGRGTSVDEGTWLAWTISEELLDSSAFVLFTSHFLFLSKLENVYHNVRNFYFETQISDNGNLVFTHKMLPGRTSSQHYGIQLAKMAGFFDDVLHNATTCAEILAAESKEEPEVKNLTAAYELAKRFEDFVSQQGEPLDLAACAPTVRQFKDMYMELHIDDEVQETMRKMSRRKNLNNADNEEMDQEDDHHLEEEGNDHQLEDDQDYVEEMENENGRSEVTDIMDTQNEMVNVAARENINLQHAQEIIAIDALLNMRQQSYCQKI